MPELPEVETVLRGLKRRVLGRTLGRAEVLHPQIIAGSPDEFIREVSRRRAVSARRKGKAIAVELGPPPGGGSLEARYLLIRLGMTGQLTVTASAAPLEPHTHARLPLDDGREEIRYRDTRRFGRLRIGTREEIEAILGRMGPDAPAISRPAFSAALRGRRGPIKSWLMNQQVLAGLGNIYADEALFLARIHPLTPAGRISAPAAERLRRAVRKVLKQAVERQGTTFRDYIDIDGESGNYAMRLRVYQRTGKPCRRCRALIRRVVIAGRSSHFCPRCQRTSPLGDPPALPGRQ